MSSPRNMTDAEINNAIRLSRVAAEHNRKLAWKIDKQLKRLAKELVTSDMVSDYTSLTESMISCLSQAEACSTQTLKLIEDRKASQRKDQAHD